MSHRTHPQHQDAASQAAQTASTSPDSYPNVDAESGTVNGTDIPAFAGTTLASFRHIPGDVGKHVPAGSVAATNIQKNQAHQLQIRLGLNDPDRLLQSAQFDQGADYSKMQANGNPTQYPDVFVWPSATENRKGLNLSDAQSIVDYFTAQKTAKHPDAWPTIKHEVGPTSADNQ